MRVAKLCILLFAAMAASFFVGNLSGRAGADGVAQSLPANASAVLSEGGPLQSLSLSQL